MPFHYRNKVAVFYIFLHCFSEFKVPVHENFRKKIVFMKFRPKWALIPFLQSRRQTWILGSFGSVWGMAHHRRLRILRLCLLLLLEGPLDFLSLSQLAQRNPAPSSPPPTPKSLPGIGQPVWCWLDRTEAGLGGAASWFLAPQNEGAWLHRVWLCLHAAGSHVHLQKKKKNDVWEKRRNYVQLHTAHTQARAHTQAQITVWPSPLHC